MMFNTEQMNQAVFAFRCYEDASLRYTGKDDSLVQLFLHNQQLAIVPMLKPAFNLEALLAQVTATNRHAEVPTGPAVGGEAW